MYSQIKENLRKAVVCCFLLKVGNKTNICQTNQLVFNLAVFSLVKSKNGATKHFQLRTNLTFVPPV